MSVLKARLFQNSSDSQVLVDAFFRAYFNKSDASNALHLSANYKIAPRTRFVALSPRTRRGSALRALHSAHAPSLSRPTQRLIHTRTLASSLSRLAPYAARRLFGRRTSSYEYLFSASTHPALRVIEVFVASRTVRRPAALREAYEALRVPV